MLAEFKAAVFNEFEMTDNGLMSYFLGIEVKQQQDGIFISEKKYMKEILEKFKISKPNSHMNEAIKGMKWRFHRLNSLQESSGSLRYLTITRPNIVYGVRLVIRYMKTPKESHRLAGKKILRYIKC